MLGENGKKATALEHVAKAIEMAIALLDPENQPAQWGKDDVLVALRSGRHFLEQAPTGRLLEG